MSLAAIAQAVGPIAGTLFSNEMAQRAASDNRIFQRDMSSTAHQREVADLRAAGLNPILSAGGPGASTPGGAQADVGDLGASTAKGIEAYQQRKMQQKQFEQIDTGIRNTNEDTKNKQKQGEQIAEQTAQLKLQQDQTRKDIERQGMSNKVLQETMNSMIKKAKAEGDYTEPLMLMQIIQSGATSAGQIMGIGPILNQILQSLPKKKNSIGIGTKD